MTPTPKHSTSSIFYCYPPPHPPPLLPHKNVDHTLSCSAFMVFKNMSVVPDMFLYPSRNDGGPHRNCALYTRVILVPSVFSYVNNEKSTSKQECSWTFLYWLKRSHWSFRPRVASDNPFLKNLQCLTTYFVSFEKYKWSGTWFPRLSGVTMATSWSESTRDFLKLSFHMFPYNEILKVFKSKIWVDILKNHPKIPLNTKFQRNQSQGLRSYEHLKFRHTRLLKYRLWRHNDVIVVTSQTFLLPLCRIHQSWHLYQISWLSEQ